MEAKRQLENQEDKFLEHMPEINGCYSEHIISPTCDLEVYKTCASIRFYFPGIDRRHNGTFVTIREEEIDDYIKAYQDNWHQAETMRETARMCPNTQLNSLGKKGMRISVCNDSISLYLDHYNLPICSKDKCDYMIEQFEYAKNRIAQIRSLIWK